ncbi:MAG: hypothetical protein IJY61_04720 [Candidatus Gastranaerophilales bacterium]|nr:hypothetical protein [Candidatus Gastranaerophilales bacterium]
MQISFGKKIPIAQCQIQNLKTGKFEPATVYELDCTDESDLLEVVKPTREWLYATYIHDNMCDRIELQNVYKEYDNSSFYILQNKDGETLGMSQVEEIYEGAFDLSYLDTKKKKPYKYVGQTLLATVAREVYQKATDAFSVYGAVDSARDFYEKICGFKIGEFDMPYLPYEEIPAFIEQTESRTHAPIIDLKV